MTTDADPSDGVTVDAERRAADRRKWIVTVRFQGGDATGIAQTSDISLGGLYLTTDAEIAPGAEIFLTLEVAGKEIGIRAAVAYIENGRGMGVRFTDLSEAAEAALRGQLGLE